MVTSPPQGDGGASLRFQPQSPFSATVSTVLSQDAVMTATIPVDSESPSPAAPFTNPASGGQPSTPAVEALVVANGQLGHATRDPSTEAGWRLGVLFGGVDATEVAAGTSYAGTQQATIYGLFQDATTLHSIELASNGTDWSSPTPVSPTSNTNLRTTYSPAGRLVVYGQTASGDLIVAYTSPGTGFVTKTYSMPHPLSAGNHYLCMTDETSWTLAAKVGDELWIYTGVLGGTSTEPSSGGRAQNYSGTVSQVVLGYWSQYQSALMFLFVDATGALQTWVSSSGSVMPIPPANPGSSVTSAAGHVYVDPESGVDSIHVYTIDDNHNLAVLHQDRDTPWDSDGTPNWAPFLPLDTEIAGLAIDTSPADVPSVFALTADTYSLRLHHQDPVTRMWATGEVLQSGAHTFEVVRYRAEVNLIDAAGRPLPLHPVSIAVAPNYSGVDVWAGGQTYPITSAQGADLSTDATGKLTLAVLTTTGLAAPSLVLTADGLPTSLTIQPAQGVHTYLSGTGTLNPTNPPSPANGSGPLPVFDSAGTTLQSATVGGHTLAGAAHGNSALAGVAAAAIQQTAMVGLDQTPTGVAGYKVRLQDPEHPTFQILSTQDEVDTHVAALRAPLPGDIWSDVRDFFSDIWEGIKNGVIAVKDFVVDCAKKVANFVLEVAGEIKSGIQLALQGLEQAAHFIAGVFQAVEADIEKVIDWLKALFDFGAIWRTKMAFESALNQAPTYVKQVVQLGEKAADGWFAKQEATVNAAFEAAIRKYEGQTYEAQPGFQKPGGPPDASTKVAGGATPSDFSHNPHHNWLQDKVSSYSGSSTLGLQADSSMASPWHDFVTHVDAAGDDFIDALKELANGVKATIRDPNSFGTVAIPDFLTALQDLVDSLLEFCDAIVDAFMSIAAVAMDALEKFLTTPLKAGFLEELWSWIAAEAGYPEDDQLTVSALIALLGAFPTTVIFKLVAGVDKEPFPPSNALAAAPGIVMPAGAVLASAILQTFYVAPALISDILGNESPTWLNVGMLGFSAVIWATANGYPDLSSIEWIAASVVAANLLWIAPTVYFVVEAVANTLLSWIKANWNDIANVLVTVYGVGAFILHIVLDFLSTPDAEQVVAGLLLPLPSLFAFVNLSTFRDDPEVAPFAIATKVAFDFIGYIGGGISQVIDAMNRFESPQPA